MNKFRLTIIGLFLFAGWMQGISQQVGTCGVKTRISVTSTSDTRVQLCASDDSPSILQFRASSPALPYVILVTDDSGLIHAVSYQLSINFDQFPAGRYRVYVLSFLGSLRAKPGMNAFEDSLAKLCYGLSANYIIVSTLPPNGGDLTFSDGSRSAAFCPGNGVSDILSFTSDSPDAGMHYLITDTTDLILDVVDQPYYDFDKADGSRRIWGLSLTGSVPDIIGLTVQEASLNGPCSSVSEGFITASPVFPEGGAISFGSGVSSIRQCTGDPRNASLALLTSSQVGAAYAYLLTDSLNQFVQWLSGSILNVPGLDVGAYRVWGVSYTGRLNTNLFGDIHQLALSDNCMELSANHLEVEVYAVNSGEITTSEGLQLVRICLNDGQAGKFSFRTQIFPGYSGVLVAVDESGIVQGVFDVDVLVDFLPLPGSYSKVYSLSYEGALQLQPGMSLQDATVTGGCMALSGNYVEIMKDNPQGGVIQYEDETTEKDWCFVEGQNPGAVKLKTSGTGDYRYLLVDTRDVIRGVFESGAIDLGLYPTGTYRIYGLAFTGMFQIYPQAHIENFASLADGCTSLSENFVSVSRYNLVGGTISASGAGTVICADGLSSQELMMTSTSTQYPKYGYILTDTDGQIVRSYAASTVTFEPMDAGDFWIWGLAYSGELTQVEGELISDAGLSSGCYALSQNYVVVSRMVVNGGTIADQNGKTNYTGCVDPGGEKELYVSFLSEFTGERNVYILTDVSNKVLAIQESSFFSFEGFLPGSFRVWHLAYSGELQLKRGQKIEEGAAATGCYDYSDNYISVALESPDGGTVKLSTGATELSLCIGGGSGFVSFRNTSTTSLPYQYVLTNEQEQVILVLVGSNFDISVAPAGSYRVYGISYTGKLTLKAGMNIRTAAISDRCYAVSRNYIILRNELVRGGEIAFSDDLVNPIKYICPEEQGAKPLSLLRIGTQGSSYAFLAIDNSGTIVSVGTNEGLSLSGLPEGEYQIWGLAYSGALYAAPGINPATTPLAERCASLSSNALRVTWSSPLGGTVALAEGGLVAAVCPDSLSPKRVAVIGLDQVGGRVTFILTDEKSSIIAVDESGIFQLDSLADGYYKVWSLTYNGTLLAEAGLNVETEQLATTCYALSSNTVSVNKEQPIAGMLEVAILGTTDSVVCSGGVGSEDKQLKLTASSSSKTPYVFLATDTLNQLRFVVSEMPVKDTSSRHEAIIALDNMPGGRYKMWGLAYTGNLQLATDMRIDTAALSDDCFALSEPTSFVLESADGAQIQAQGFIGDTVFVCIGDNKQDSIYFTNTSTGSGGGYRYVLTNTANLVLAELNGNVMNFENAGFKELRLWGISYTGTYTSVRSKNLLTAIPSDGCYEISTNFITIFRDVPVGGTISIGGSTADQLFCPGRDGYTVQVKTTSVSKTGYVYILTDTIGAVREISESGLIDFRNHAMGSYRVHGVAYTGNLLVQLGDTLRMGIPLASSCYQLATNYLRITRGAEVNGQSVSTLFGETTIGTCPRDGLLDLVILNLPVAGSESEYQLMLTNEQNQLIYPNIPGGLLDFEGIEAGVYRIWGISFGGNFIGQFNTVVGSENLSTGCFDLSDNYVTVIAETPKGGTVFAGNNLTNLVVNRSDAFRDVYFFGKKDASPRAPYAFLITNERNEIIEVVSIDSIDLDKLDTGKYRVWGLAYTGSLLASPGGVLGTNLLSDNCHELSSNFVQIEVRSSSNIPNVGEPDSPRIVTSTFSRPLQLQIAPNPALDVVHLLFSSPTEEPLQLSVFSMNGVLVRTQKINAVQGSNQVALDVQTELPGVYILRLANKGTSESVRLIKL